MFWVEEALCFGWIDSKGNKRDEESFYLLFAKRNPLSKWSAANKKRVEKLLAAQLIMSGGMVMIELAKQTGTWQALDAVEALTIPVDLEKAFKKNKDSKKYFTAFPNSVKRGILEWISNAKQEVTRSKRIEQTATLAAQNIRANQYNPKK
jgi:uncharacterized protein YdeI (YjbR/CyaY-like superfamily)